MINLTELIFHEKDMRLELSTMYLHVCISNQCSMIHLLSHVNKYVAENWIVRESEGWKMGIVLFPSGWSDELLQCFQLKKHFQNLYVASKTTKLVSGI